MTKEMRKLTRDTGSAGAASLHGRSAALRWTAALLLAAGCGSDPGEGTRTLFVEAELKYEPGSFPTTKVNVVVRKGSADGPTVTGAAVAFTGEKFRYEPVSDGKGRYKGEFAGYVPDLSLTVESGADHLTAFLEGPDAFAIVSPKDGAAVDVRSGEPVLVEWDPEQGRAAEEVQVEISGTEGLAAVLTTDEGSATLAADRFRLDRHKIVVRRSKALLLAGGVPGSILRMTYVAETNVSVVR